ncbi:MAG: phosphate propanoyltransferase [Candidatus Nanoarchaeia archaeon]|nr:phosphate propanoyltransferase [Candidatus Nanoarchaeia archaeon]MDD5357924.1 phosphate propanoyltransferase [Candidatus Nanoarchaeia archaeon]MDD5588843.1 phosphate propanoyltransferase [Candidatus Nanoarchaeia archaeon]
MTKIPIEISARHIHLSEKDFEKLFGKNKTLTPMKKLSQIGEFASEEKVTLINSGRKIENVRILGPFRKNSQAEISLTDAYNLKLNPLPKIKVSGDLANTTNILVKGPKSSVKIPCIIAKRHLHCSIEEAGKLKLKNNQKVSVKISGERETIFQEIIVRTNENFRLSLHLDTDEGNAAGITGRTFGELIK